MGSPTREAASSFFLRSRLVLSVLGFCKHKPSFATVHGLQAIEAPSESESPPPCPTFGVPYLPGWLTPLRFLQRCLQGGLHTKKLQKSLLSREGKSKIGWVWKTHRTHGELCERGRYHLSNLLPQTRNSNYS